MALLRFATARDVFEAFPTAHEDINTAPSDQPPIAYLRELEERLLEGSAEGGGTHLGRDRVDARAVPLHADAHVAAPAQDHELLGVPHRQRP